MTSNHTHYGVPSDPERSEIGQNVHGSTPRRSFNDIGEMEKVPDPILQPRRYVNPVEQTSIVRMMNPRRIRRRHMINAYYRLERAVYNALYWTAFWLGVVIVGLWVAVMITAVMTGFWPW
jgi:hypothetical protein